MLYEDSPCNMICIQIMKRDMYATQNRSQNETCEMQSLQIELFLDIIGLSLTTTTEINIISKLW